MEKKEWSDKWSDKIMYKCDDCGTKYSEQAWSELPELDDGTHCDSCGGLLVEIE